MRCAAVGQAAGWVALGPPLAGGGGAPQPPLPASLHAGGGGRPLQRPAACSSILGSTHPRLRVWCREQTRYGRPRGGGGAAARTAGPRTRRLLSHCAPRSWPVLGQRAGAPAERREDAGGSGVCRAEGLELLQCRHSLRACSAPWRGRQSAGWAGRGAGGSRRPRRPSAISAARRRTRGCPWRCAALHSTAAGRAGQASLRWLAPSAAFGALCGKLGVELITFSAHNASSCMQ